MLRQLLNSEPKRLFIGTIGVSGHRDLTRSLEELTFSAPAPLESALLAELIDTFAWPPFTNEQAPRPTDVTVDIVLQGYRRGTATDVSLGSLGLPLIWRPRIRIAARLYHPQGESKKRIYDIAEYMPWSQFILRVLSWKTLIGLSPPASRKDLVELLHRAAARLKARVEEAH